jgi:hypothetical protein
MVSNVIDWGTLIFGTYSPQQVVRAVNDSQWQDVRISMIGESEESKYNILLAHLVRQHYSGQAKIQVTNYVNALKRGGLIK